MSGAEAGAWLGGAAVGAGGVGVAALLQAPRTRTAIAAMVPRRFAGAIKGVLLLGPARVRPAGRRSTCPTLASCHEREVSVLLTVVRLCRGVAVSQIASWIYLLALPLSAITAAFKSRCLRPAQTTTPGDVA